MYLSNLNRRRRNLSRTKFLERTFMTAFNLREAAEAAGASKSSIWRG
jgi:hypothetical protein